MGIDSFLIGGNPSSPQSVDESISQLDIMSLVFVRAWKCTPKDSERADRASRKAMLHLDHIVNEIMRNRDQLQADRSYSGSELERQLNIPRAMSVSPATRQDQYDLVNRGPGNGVLPSAGSPLAMEKLLNKIKHRRTDSYNFRIEPSGDHVFLMGVDKQNRQPDSIVEFVVAEFCQHCRDIAELI